MINFISWFKKGLCDVLYTRKRKATALSFTLYYPIQSVLVAAPAPIPFPVLQVTPEMIALFNFISLLITIAGGFTGFAFWVQRQSTKRFDAQDSKIDKLEEKQDKSFVKLDTKIEDKATWLYDEIKESKNAIQHAVSLAKEEFNEKNDENVKVSKELVDEKFRNVDRIHQEHKERISNLENRYFNDALGSSRTKKNEGESR